MDIAVYSKRAFSCIFRKSHIYNKLYCNVLNKTCIIELSNNNNNNLITRIRINSSLYFVHSRNDR